MASFQPRDTIPMAFSRHGLTLLETLAVVLLIWGIFAGGVIGLNLAASYGPWARAAGAVLGAAAGMAGVVAIYYLLLLPLEIIDAVRRAMEPADLVCRCREPGRTVPEHLRPRTPVELQAVEESRQVAQWLECVRGGANRAATVEDLGGRLNADSLSIERIALAARLGDPSTAALDVPLVKPVINYPNWARLPEDVHTVLRSGLPPRLCLAWALACAERVLPVFESEFHEDTRPRQIVGAALMVVRDGDVAAREICGPSWPMQWPLREGGCRVLHRGLLERIRGRRSPGERAMEAIWCLARAVSDFDEPSGLWAVYPPGDIAHGYMTAQNRCEWSQPAFRAEQVASAAILASADAVAERQWQREELARMVVGWPRWDEDREAWRVQVDEEWIPRVRANLQGVRFDIPAYMERIRREFVPWRKPV